MTYSGYVNDTWRYNNKLSFNLGVRYDKNNGSNSVGQTVIKDLYGLEDAKQADVERIAEAWRPYRMWAVVLLRMGWTRAQGGNVSYRRG